MPAFLIPLLPILGEIAKQFVISALVAVALKWAAILVGIIVISYALYQNW